MRKGRRPRAKTGVSKFGRGTEAHPRRLRSSQRSSGEVIEYHVTGVDGRKSFSENYQRGQIRPVNRARSKEKRNHCIWQRGGNCEVDKMSFPGALGMDT